MFKSIPVYPGSGLPCIWLTRLGEAGLVEKKLLKVENCREVIDTGVEAVVEGGGLIEKKNNGGEYRRKKKDSRKNQGPARIQRGGPLGKKNRKKKGRSHGVQKKKKHGKKRVKQCAVRSTSK